MTTPEVRLKNQKTYTGDGVYIGRPSPLGNPYAIGKDGSREEVIAKYRIWLMNVLDTDCDATKMFVRMFDELCEKNTLTLVCWCVPLPCHGEVIRELLLSAWTEKFSMEGRENPTPPQ